MNNKKIIIPLILLIITLGFVFYPNFQSYKNLPCWDYIDSKNKTAKLFGIEKEYYGNISIFRNGKEIIVFDEHNNRTIEFCEIEKKFNLERFLNIEMLKKT